MSTHAGVLADEIRADLQPVEERLLAHPYLAALEEARIPREKLRLFAGEQYAIIGSDLRSVAHLASRFGDSPSREFFLSVLQGERTAWEALQMFALAIGVDEVELRSYEPLAGAHAYTCYMAWLALYGSDAEVAAAYLVNFPAWGASCGRMSRSLQEHYGLAESEVGFFDLFAAPAPEFEQGALSVIERRLERGDDPRGIRRAARLLQAYELLYWDTLYGASDVGRRTSDVAS
jgi:pyrroloquinoline quinone (PQQ) biosynthesis protein C